MLTVSSRRRAAFDEETVAALQEIAASSALFLRRMQLHRATRGKGRPFLIKGLSPEWLEVERKMERVAATNAPVLVTGESGTGKELTAHALHFNSRRSDGPFVTVNCAAIPETLLESVLFGHVKGAFTGATSDKRGEFVKADGGTLFLDELGELPVPLQAKVLRAVEDGEVQPLGSNDAPLSVDVRFVAATNRDLASMMQRGDFRGDLYYRLSVMTLELPPLRRYKHDNLEVMARVFLEQAAEKHGRDVRRITRRDRASRRPPRADARPSRSTPGQAVPGAGAGPRHPRRAAGALARAARVAVPPRPARPPRGQRAPRREGGRREPGHPLPPARQARHEPLPVLKAAGAPKREEPATSRPRAPSLERESFSAPGTGTGRRRRGSRP